MSDIIHRKSWLLRVELAAIVCLVFICIVKDVILKPGSVAAEITKNVFKRNLDYPDNAKPQNNIITSILYSEEKPSVTFDDVRIAQEADVIKGVKIVKIYKDKVEFEKDGQYWIQKIGERLNNTEQLQTGQERIYWNGPETDERF